jgi:hypothetical protein
MQDAVRTGWLTPEEDVLALSVLGGLGWNLRHVFPRTVRFDPAGAAALCETSTFAAALRMFTRKLVHLHRKPVLLKSPPHIDWLPGILRVFPQARFVTIFRDPLRHYASLRAAERAGGPTWSALQCAPGLDDDDRLAGVEFSLERYFSSGRHLIPAGSLVEIRHEDLVADEPGTLLRIQRALAGSGPPGLGLSAPGAACEPRPYATNVYPEPDAATCTRIIRAYRHLYEAGYYRPPGRQSADGSG